MTPTLEEAIRRLRLARRDPMSGESVDIIARNGAGKGALLKILSRITEPSAG